ncbi:hypothetical protein [Inquilinus limosus]|uniref:Uncharacterized protein n=1 Tax=Inquilinus limosus MP06 TaxID=1398085 RepID=A0A0A0DBL3_9PROT|nr:hypothetical protein [Inquilinus limosus]KGM36111.1 hypothetical protein P409_00225 [Inquilinus limosus MP06]
MEVPSTTLGNAIDDVSRLLAALNQAIETAENLGVDISFEEGRNPETGNTRLQLSTSIIL